MRRANRPASRATPGDHGAVEGVELVEEQGGAIEAARGLILNNLVAFNASVAPPPEWTPFAITARDVDGVVVGGATGQSQWRWLFLSHLWVSEARRGQGLGSQLIADVENLARRRECVGVHLDTFSFQAEPFYLGLGYTRFGVLDDYPPGFQRYYLEKRLAWGPRAPGGATGTSD